MFRARCLGRHHQGEPWAVLDAFQDHDQDGKEEGQEDKPDHSFADRGDEQDLLEDFADLAQNVSRPTFQAKCAGNRHRDRTNLCLEPAALWFGSCSHLLLLCVFTQKARFHLVLLGEEICDPRIRDASGGVLSPPSFVFGTLDGQTFFFFFFFAVVGTGTPLEALQGKPRSKRRPQGAAQGGANVRQGAVHGIHKALGFGDLFRRVLYPSCSTRNNGAHHVYAEGRHESLLLSHAAFTRSA
mmetsp:Transcript_94225/g.196650  ORF Transcript_94225/g.196650 Transcript_94225/m.196650 type:complete len:241 (+) Transcript_94225:2015-2737(+)